MYDPTGILLLLPAPIQILNFSFVFEGAEARLEDALSEFADAMRPPAAAHTAYMGGTPEIFGSGLGLAYVGALYYPFGVVQATDRLSLAASTTLFAHELGHILGAPHDGDGNTAPTSGFIMASVSATEFSGVSLLALEGAQLPGAPGSLTGATAVPLPAPGLLALGGLGALALVRRRAKG